MKVVMIFGFSPADASHLVEISQKVDLCVYHSRWRPAYARGSGEIGMGVPERRFEPVFRSRRGHLWFWYRGVAAAIREDKPDVVHVVCEPWGMLALQAARIAHETGARLVLHGCDTIWHHGSLIERLARRTVLRKTLPVMKGWAAENKKALRVATESGLPESTLLRQIHTNPRDCRTFCPPDPTARRRARARLGVSSGYVVTMLGRLVPEKGVAQLIGAAEILEGQRFPATIFIAGDGPERLSVERATPKNIVYLGPVSYPEGVLDLLHASDILVCPSLSTEFWEDQGPRSVLEAMMCGVTPVVTPTGALPSMVGENGVVTDSVTEIDIAEGIRTAATGSDDPGYRNELSQWSTDQFSSEAVSRALIDFWMDVAETSPLP